MLLVFETGEITITVAFVTMALSGVTGLLVFARFGFKISAALSILPGFIAS